MATYDKPYVNKPNKGSIVPVAVKTNPKSPDYKGFIIADEDIKKGDKVKLAVWAKTSQWGEFLSLSIDRYVPKEGKQVQYPRPAPRKAKGDLDDEIPW